MSSNSIWLVRGACQKDLVRGKGLLWLLLETCNSLPLFSSSTQTEYLSYIIVVKQVHDNAEVLVYN